MSVSKLAYQLEAEVDIMMKREPGADSPLTRFTPALGWAASQHQTITSGQHFGNDNPSYFHPLGGKMLLSKGDRNASPIEPCCYFDSNKLHISLPLKIQLEQPFAPQLLENFSLIYVGNGKGKTKLPPNCATLIETKLQPYFLVHVISCKSILGGLYPIQTIQGPGHNFGIMNTGKATFVATPDTYCHCDYVSFDSLAKKRVFNANHTVKTKYRLYSIFGLHFFGNQCIEGTESVCLTRPFKIGVGRKMDNSWAHQICDLYLPTPRSRAGQKILKLCKERIISPQAIFFKLYDVDQINILIASFNLSKKEGDFFRNSLVHVQDIIGPASPFDTSMLICPQFEGPTLAYLLTPAVLTEMVIRYYLTKDHELIL